MKEIINLLKENLIIFGLGLNFIGAIFLAFPIIKSVRNVEKDDRFNHMDKNGNYETGRDKRNKYLGIVGIVFLATGFLLQIINQYTNK